MNKDNLFFPVAAGMAISANREPIIQTASQKYCSDKQMRQPRQPLTTANCYEQGFRFDEIDRRFK